MDFVLIEHFPKFEPRIHATILENKSMEITSEIIAVPIYDSVNFSRKFSERSRTRETVDLDAGSWLKRFLFLVIFFLLLLFSLVRVRCDRRMTKFTLETRLDFSETINFPG